MENPSKMDDLGGKPTIFGNIHILPSLIFQFPVSKKIAKTPKEAKVKHGCGATTCDKVRVWMD